MITERLKAERFNSSNNISSTGSSSNCDSNNFIQESASEKISASKRNCDDAIIQASKRVNVNK